MEEFWAEYREGKAFPLSVTSTSSPPPPGFSHPSDAGAAGPLPPALGDSLC